MPMTTLAKHNPYLRDTRLRHRMIEDSVRESSILEEAKCFHSSSPNKLVPMQSRKNHPVTHSPEL